jgi:hypothetical protein
MRSFKGFINDSLTLSRFLRKNQVCDPGLSLALGGRERLCVNVERDPEISTLPPQPIRETYGCSRQASSLSCCGSSIGGNGGRIWVVVPFANLGRTTQRDFGSS